jgi:hypothetical protein
MSDEPEQSDESYSLLYGALPVFTGQLESTPYRNPAESFAEAVPIANSCPATSARTAQVALNTDLASRDERGRILRGAMFFHPLPVSRLLQLPSSCLTTAVYNRCQLELDSPAGRSLPPGITCREVADLGE